MSRGNWGRRKNNPNYKKSAKIARIEGKNIRQEIQTTVRSYWDTPHVSTGESPNKLMFGRELNGRLPAKLSKQTVRESVQRRDAEFKQKCKTYADNRRHAKASNIRLEIKSWWSKTKSMVYLPDITLSHSWWSKRRIQWWLSRMARKRCAGIRLSEDEWQPSSKRRIIE